MYAYVGNDPARMVDPLGLVECGWWNQNCSFGDPAGAAPRCATAECAAGLGYKKPSCQAVCVAAFVNPLPDVLIEDGLEFLARSKFGDTTALVVKDAAKKANKIRGAYDLAMCISQCRKNQSCDAQ